MKKILILFSIVLLFYGCPKSTPTTPDLPQQKNLPTINNFTANPSEIFKGNNSTLSWSSSNATTISINQGIGTVNNSGSIEVSPTETTIYTLTVSNNNSTVTKGCIITVRLNLPNIEKFSLTPSSVNYGDSSDLYWYVSNATKVEIDQSIGIVGQNVDPVQGIQKVSPTTTTNYTLTAINNDGRITYTSTLFVISVANLIIDGNLQRTMTDNDHPKFEGYVKNIGNKTAWNITVLITCYSDAAKTTIIDTAKGFPANLGNIPPNARVYFDATAFNLSSHTQIAAIDITIDFLERNSMFNYSEME